MSRELKISESVAKKLQEIARQMGGGSVNVGFLENATYPDGTPVAAVAFWNEFGTERTVESADGKESQVVHTPPRAFFRGMIAKESPGWGGKMGAFAKATNYNGPKVLALMGEDIDGALKQSINDFTTPPLAPSTVKAKGFDKPLINKAIMINSTGYEVKK
jgi:hypothetical protein